MPSAPYHLISSAARAHALFASPLQRSDEPSARQIRQAIAAQTVLRGAGRSGCYRPRWSAAAGQYHRRNGVDLSPHDHGLRPSSRTGGPLGAVRGGALCTPAPDRRGWADSGH